MNKKAQGLIVGLIILIVVVIAVLWFLFVYSPSQTGKAIQEIDKVICNSPYIRVGASCCLDENSNKICDKDEETITAGNLCTINSPFGCEEYTINTNGIKLVVRNGGGEAYSIKRIEIDNCGATSVRIQDYNNLQTFLISCKLSLNTYFSGKVDITYTDTNLNEKHVFGQIKGVVLEEKKTCSFFVGTQVISKYDCANKLDCINRVSDIMNDYGISSNDVSVIDCLQV